MRSFAKVMLSGAAFVVLALLLTIGALGALRVTDPVALPALAIVGVVVLLASLAMVAVTFAHMGIGDSAQALALPEGSVRAVIALCLLILFAILSIYLFAKISTPMPIQEITNLSKTEQENLVRSVSPTDLAGTKAVSDGTFTVYLRQSVRPESTDFAKQLLVMLGTLVVSISSFYFGSKAANEGNRTPQGSKPGEQGAANAALSSLRPDAILRSQITQVIMAIGSGLATASAASLSKGNSVVKALQVTPTDSSVLCEFLLDNSIEPGVWQLTLMGSDGRPIGKALPLTVS